MKVILTEEEWNEYQKLKSDKLARKPNPLTGKVVYRHDLARPKIEEYLNRVVGVRFPFISQRDQHELYNTLVDVAKYTFEESTGEKF